MVGGVEGYFFAGAVAPFLLARAWRLRSSSARCFCSAFSCAAIPASTLLIEFSSSSTRDASLGKAPTDPSNWPPSSTLPPRLITSSMPWRVRRPSRV
jgi:hypothetical protein